ncbi:hypothetical protein CCYN49044_130006 [Capnocytophaga cynodegmi]|uniref:Uncharacterized protein n=1 Tax=Capnocytophaga cynodegmi TaxID=28189 RepID=A0A0B7H9E5_9FLAO|nr:hypothetical protein CCYN49044_130006 [Capnocytophaga cynodegmi]CEN41625.1 hypothetical protein CCYN74_70071 [Capnocytophaga cynodegmi]
MKPFEVKKSLISFFEVFIFPSLYYIVRIHEEKTYDVNNANVLDLLRKDTE